MAQTVHSLPAMWEIWVQSLGWEDPRERAMATHSSILAWRTLWTEESGGLQSVESQSDTTEQLTLFHFSRLIYVHLGNLGLLIYLWPKPAVKLVLTQGKPRNTFMPKHFPLPCHLCRQPSWGRKYTGTDNLSEQFLYSLQSRSLLTGLEKQLSHGGKEGFLSCYLC